MKRSKIWSRIGDFLMGKGFYMVLLLCVMAIGGSGYYLYHLATEDLSGQTVSATAEVEVPAREAAGASEVEQVADAIAEAEERARAAAEAETAAQEAAAEEHAAETAPEVPAAEETAAETPSEMVSGAAQEAAAVEEAPAEAVSAAEETPAQETAAAEEPAEEAAGFASPVPGEVVAAFSDSELTYNAALGDWRTHNGVDLAAHVGDAVCAVRGGEVLSVGEDVLLGTTITLNHGDGLMTVYGNLDPDVAVEQGDTVSAGEVIGAVGETAAGEHNEGAWLHFAVLRDGEMVDPAEYLG